MANLLQIDLDGYGNPFVLKHLGAALCAIAADMGDRYAVEPKDKCGCTGSTLAPPPVTPEAPPIATFGPTMPPLEENVVHIIAPERPTPAVQPMVTPTTEVIDEDDDAGWPPLPGESVSTSDLDSAGFPWDARIHAGSKAKMKADGTWKLKPGVDKALVDRVRAETHGVTATPPVQPVTPVAPPPPPAATLVDAVTVSAELQAPPAPPVSAVPANFAELIQEVTKRITAGSLTADQVNGAVSLATGGQLTMCNQLAARQDLIPAVWAVLVPA